MLGRFVQVYCDDILIFSKTRAEHLAHVRMVLETLRHHQLYAKASKCNFGRSSVGFLGHVISEHGVAVDPRKVAAVAEWAPPTSCTEVRRFVGLAQVRLALLCVGRPPDGPMQSPRYLPLGFLGGADSAELRSPQGGADLGPGSPCVGPGALAHRRI
jgi:hypothetical protein